ncbi:MAG: transposase [Candidatus Hodarchaeales archaeon]
MSSLLLFEVQLKLELVLRGLLERIRACSEVDSELVKKVKDPSIRGSLEILNSIPGISGISALHLLSEIECIDRFHSKRHVVSWAGLCSRVYSSGGKTSRGHIAKRGNSHVQRILFQATRVSSRARKKPLKACYQRLRTRKLGRVALVALARKLLVIIHILLKSGQTFAHSSLMTEIK